MRDPTATRLAGPAPRRSRRPLGFVRGPLFLLGAQACSGAPEAAEGISLQVAPAELRPMRITAEADGELEPVLKVEVKSKASGEILDLFVDSGDEVEEGKVLARVDPRDVRNGYDQAKADLDVAEAREKNARAQLNRNRELLAEEVITRQAFEATELEFANAQAGLVRARTNKELAELRLTDVTIMAPMAGTILEKRVEDGQVIQSATQNVSGGTTLFIMADLDDMRVRMLVDETDVGKLAAGLSATVSVEAFPDRTFRGSVEKIEPQALVQQNVTMFPVIVRLDNRAGLLKPGMNAAVEVLVNERTETLAVPNNAIVQPQEATPAAEVLGLDPESAPVDFRAWGPLMAEAAGRFEELEGGSQSARTAGGDLPGASRDGGRGGLAGVGPGAGGRGTSGAGGTSGGANGAPNFADLRAKVRSGEISQDSLRALRAAVGQRGRGGARPGRDTAREDGSTAAGRAADGAGDAEESGGGREGGRGAARGADRGGGGRGGFGGFRGGPMAAMGGATGDRAYRPAVAFVVDSAGNITPRPVVIGLSDWDYVEILAGLEPGEELALIGAAQLQARQQERLNRIRQRMRPF